MKRWTVLGLMIVCMLTAGIVFGLSSSVFASGAEDYLNRSTQYYTETEGGKIRVEDMLISRYLFLPNEADTEHISIKSDDPNEKITFDVNGSEVVTLNLGSVKKVAGKTTVKIIVRDSAGNKKKSLTMKIMTGTGIGTVYYNSKDSDQHGRLWIEQSKENRGSGKAIVFDEKGTNLTAEAKNQVIEDIHGRGDQSWDDPKKGYQIKFDKKISLIDGTGKEKKWVLLAQYKDPLRLSDVICKEIGALTRTDYSPKGRLVNFYYDGEYRGVYELSEKVEVKGSRVNISDAEDEYKKQDPGYGDHPDLEKDVNKYGLEYQYQKGLTGPEEPGGFLFELNSIAYNEDNGFKFKVRSDERAVNIKSPELGSKESVKYISEYFQGFCNAASAVDARGEHTGIDPETGKSFSDYCDMNSLVDSYLLNSLTSNSDSFFKSQYFYKDKGGKMISGPMWDYDLCFGAAWEWEMPPEYDYLTDTLIAGDLIRIREFRQAVSKRYRELYSKILESLISSGKLLPSFKQSYQKVSDDLAMDTVLWPEKYKCGHGNLKWDINTSLATVLDYRIDWLKKHKAFLDEYFRKMAADSEDEHTYGPFVPATAYTHQRACINHPDAVITENHTWDNGTVMQKATPSKPGRKKYTCTVCGAVKQTTIKKVPASRITIDTSSITAGSVKKIISKLEAADSTTDTIILGKKVKKIKAGAFKTAGIRKTGSTTASIRTVIMKTKRLKKGAVKGAFKGSSVATVRVKIGSKKLNKKYVKIYKKIFTKKNAGKSVKVK